jgi:hypothetical protein
MVLVMKIVRGGRVENSLQDKAKSNPYDVVMVYCRYCQHKIDVHVYHSFGKLEYYQIKNLPEKISKHLDTRNIECNKCNKTFVLEKQSKKSNTDYLLKLDCSNMSGGMESWYEGSIPKNSKEIYS